MVNKDSQNLLFWANIWLHRVLSTVRPPRVIHTAAMDRGKLVKNNNRSSVMHGNLRWGCVGAPRTSETFATTLSHGR